MEIAVVGAGVMGRWHSCTSRKLGVRVGAIVDPNVAAAEELARSVGAAAVFSSVEGLFREAVDLDVVHICTPLESHVAISKQAIERGIHVVCEKPLAATAPETEELLEYAARAGRIVRPVHQFAAQRGVERAQTLLADLGALSRITFDIRSAGADGGDGERYDAVLADIVPHPFSVIARLWPDADLSRLDWHVVSPRPGEVDAHCLLADVPTSLAISMSGRPTRCAMEIHGARGTLLVDFFHGFCVRFSGTVSRFRKASYPLVDSASVFAAAARNLTLRAWRREPAYPGLEQLFRDVYRDVASRRTRPEVDRTTLAVAFARDDFLRALKSGRP